MKETCVVANKSAGRVGYTIKDGPMAVRREFMPHEVKKNIPVAELEALSQRPGGRNTLFNYLQVQDPEIINYLLNGNPPIEYWLTADKLPSWMQSCSLEEFQDALDFAPIGTKDLIKKYAVELPLADTNKITAIKEQLGYDVLKAIELSHAYDEPADGASKQAERRVQPSAPAGRRANSTIVVPETTKENTITVKEE